MRRSLPTRLKTLGRAVLAFYPIVLVAALWETAARLGLVPPVFLPPLSQVIQHLFEQLLSGDILASLLVSLYRAAAGLAIAMVGGIAIGFLMSQSRWFHWLMNPIVLLGFPAPKVAFLPIFLLWFGIDHLSKIALVAFTSIFPFIIVAQAGAATVSRVQLWAARAMGETRLGIIHRIILPAALPSLMSGLRVAVPYALISAFTAEMIAGGGGLGGDLVYAQRYFETTTVFTILLVMLAVGWLIDQGLIMIRRRVLRWHAG
jgi:ABC-type nitrate/sulfonate/bicarbonate transport system permease component